MNAEIWQIQARRKHHLADSVSAKHVDCWEPIRVERNDKTTVMRLDGSIDEVYEYRPYHYPSLEAAQYAFAQYLGIEGGFVNVLARMCSGREDRLLANCDVRFVRIADVVGFVAERPRDIPSQTDGGVVNQKVSV